MHLSALSSAPINATHYSVVVDFSWPMVTSKTYTVTLMLNWTNFQLNVQYRDEKGNLSPVSCAAISLEGTPKP